MSTGQYRLPVYTVIQDSTAVVLQHTLKENGVAADLSAAAGTLYLHVKDQEDANVATLTASWSTDGSDGLIEVQLTTGVVGTVRDLICNWEVQGYGSGNLHADPFILRVLPNAKA